MGKDVAFTRGTPMPPLRGLVVFDSDRFYKDAAPTEL
jgi:hypothetical protein